MKREVTLAIETAVGGGSVSLLENGETIDFWISDGKTSRADDLLSKISELFLNNAVKKTDLANIVYSIGPGSFTGIRIAAATVKGLKTAVGCSIRGQSILEALIMETEREGNVQIAIQCAKNQICRQFFEIRKKDRIKILSSSEMMPDDKFYASLNETPVQVFLFGDGFSAGDLVQNAQYQTSAIDKIRYILPNQNLSEIIGRFAQSYLPKGNDDFIYIEKCLK